MKLTIYIHNYLEKIKTKMAKRSFGTVRIRLSQNLRSGIFVTSKLLCVRRENSRGIKVLSVYILNGRVVYTSLSPTHNH